MDGVRPSQQTIGASQAVQKSDGPKSARPLSARETNLSFKDSRSINDFDSSHSIALIRTHQLIQTPKSETDGVLLQHTHSVSSMFFNLQQVIHFDTQPKLKDVSQEEFLDLFAKKCTQCAQICNFGDDKKQEIEKTQKTEILQDILEFIRKDEVVSKLTEKEYFALYKMFSKNIIRITPPPPEIWFSLINTDLSTELVEEISWPHMSLIYDIMTAFVSSQHFKPNYCPDEVLSLSKQIVDIFHSPDSREREKLMKFFHAFYKCCGKLRAMLRKEISTFLSVYMDSPYLSIGVNEVLNVAIPIIYGFHVPLHQEHVIFYKTVILPLHKSPYALMFHCPLATSLTVFCTKQPSLVILFIRFLKEHWPSTFAAKQILFLSEIESVIHLIPQPNIIDVLRDVVSLVAPCVSSPDYAVAERSLMMWKNEVFVNLIVTYSNTTYPILLPSLFRTVNEHWCESVRTLAVYVLRSMKDSSQQLFNEIGANLRVRESDRILSEVERGHQWKHLINKFSETIDEKNGLMEIVSKIYIGNDVGSPLNEISSRKSDSEMQNLPRVGSSEEVKKSSKSNLPSINQGQRRYSVEPTVNTSTNGQPLTQAHSTPSTLKKPVQRLGYRVPQSGGRASNVNRLVPKSILPKPKRI